MVIYKSLLLLTGFQFHYISSKAPKTLYPDFTYWDTLNKPKPSEMKGCIRGESFGLCVECFSECQNCTVCHSAPVTDSLRLRFPVSPGICQNGELHQRRAGTQLETRPHVWCALTTGETSEREKQKKWEKEVSSHPLDKRVIHRTDGVATHKNSKPGVLKQYDWCEQLLTDNH